MQLVCATAEEYTCTRASGSLYMREMLCVYMFPLQSNVHLKPACVHADAVGAPVDRDGLFR